MWIRAIWVTARCVRCIFEYRGGGSVSRNVNIFGAVFTLFVWTIANLVTAWCVSERFIFLALYSSSLDIYLWMWCYYLHLVLPINSSAAIFLFIAVCLRRTLIITPHLWPCFSNHKVDRKDKSQRGRIFAPILTSVVISSRRLPENGRSGHDPFFLQKIGSISKRFVNQP